VYDFSKCKLCGEPTAEVKYRLKQMSLYACSTCDFHYIDALDDYPANQPEVVLLNENHRKFIESKLPQNRIQLQKNLQFIRTKTEVAGGHCLDIGSGAGVFPALLQDAGAEVEGIEPQQVFREFGREKYQLSLKSELIDSPFWQEGYQEVFDVVTLWDTLEHVNFPVTTLQGAQRVLKPGGYLFLDTPSRDSFFYRASEWSYRWSGGNKPLLLNTLYSPKPFRHKQLFTRKQLWALLEDCGFADIEQSSLHRSGQKLVIACRKKTC